MKNTLFSLVLFSTFIVSSISLGGGLGLRKYYSQRLEESRLVASKEDIRLFTDIQYKDSIYPYNQRDNSRDLAIGAEEQACYFLL